MADRQHQGAGSVRRRRGVIARAVAATLVATAAAAMAATPAVACKRLNCTVSTSSTSTRTTTSTSTSTTTSTTTNRVWGTILTGGPNRPTSTSSQPVVMTEAQRIAQLAAGIKRDVYGAILPAGCGGAPPAAPCPTADPAAPTVQQVASTTTTTTTNTTRRTTVSVEELADRAKAKIRLAKPNIGSCLLYTSDAADE